MTAIPFLTSHGAARRLRRGRERRFVERALAALRDWRRRVRNRNELMALDDRTLRDIGLTRGDVFYLTSKPAERRRSWAESPRFPPF